MQPHFDDPGPLLVRGKKIGKSDARTGEKIIRGIPGPPRTRNRKDGPRVE